MANASAPRRLRIALATGTATAVAFGLAILPASASEPMPVSRQVVSAVPTAGPSETQVAPVAGEGDWQEPTASVDKSAKRLTKSVGKQESTAVVSVVKDGDKPVVVSQPVNGRKNAKQSVRKAKKSADLLYVGVEQEVRLVEPTAGGESKSAVTADLANDTKRGQQWALDRLSAESIWESERGEGVTIAVLDTGIGVHEDIPNDVIVGPDQTGGGNSRNDAHGHGTHVAGSIAAVTDNSLGIAGLAPDAQLMAVRVLNAQGSGSDSWIAAGIVAATDRGADVINMSLGGGSPGAMESAVAYAVSQGVVVVASAGNSRTEGSPTSYPAALPDVVGVGATDSADNYGYFSSAGSWVDVAAPGVSILSTTGSGYQSWNGTSMASPHAAAAIGLLIGAGADDPVGTLTDTAEDLGASGRDDDFGHGLIDPLMALSTIELPPGATEPSAPLNPVAAAAGVGEVNVAWDAPASDGGVAITRYSVSAKVADDPVQTCVWSSGPLTCSFSGLDTGTYTFAISARNGVGYSAAAESAALDVIGIPDEGGDSLEAASTLEMGEPVADLIGSADDVDYWKFVVPSNQRITATLSSVPADYDLDLLSATGAALETSGNGGTANETISETLAAGTYFLRVYGWSGAHDPDDPYSLSVTSGGAGPVDAAGDSFDTATPQAASFGLEEVLGSIGDVDYWRLDVSASGQLSADLTSLPGDYDLALYDAGRRQLAVSENWFTSDEAISHSVAAGTYYLKVLGYDGAYDPTDPYTLSSVFVADVKAPEPPVLAPEPDPPEELDPPEESDPVAVPARPSRPGVRALSRKRIRTSWRVRNADEAGALTYELSVREKSSKAGGKGRKRWESWSTLGVMTVAKFKGKVPQSRAGNRVQIKVRAIGDAGSSSWSRKSRSVRLLRR